LSKIIWDKRLLFLAEHISTWSKDPSTKVGAVLAHGKDVVGLGYNGFPKGVEDTEERLNDRPTKYKLVVHAEANAILMAGHKTNGASLYVWCPGWGNPCICNECAKLAIQAGVKEVVGVEGVSKDNGLSSRWGESMKVVSTMLDESSVTYRGVTI
jgi:dCMP deaminase